MRDPRRSIPSVDALLDAPEFAALLSTYPRIRVVDAIREAVLSVRAAVAAGDAGGAGGDTANPKTYSTLAETLLEASDVPSLRRVVNATGVVLHTNLGRAPLAEAARSAMSAAAEGYSNLEFDLGSGARGSRYSHCVGLLTELTGAEDALVVNNNAAALVLALNTLARGKGVAVSRGELVEIGGGFRVPQILERSGASLVEVGSTNRTRISDYEEALSEGGVAALLKVHRSNFRMTGFTEETPLAELAAAAARAAVPLLHDLGSGLLIEPEALGLPPEPTPRASLQGGSDVVSISCDKLLGGPQAGVLLGSQESISAMRANPLCRALRVDKVTLAGLEATLRLYRDPALARDEVPTLRALSFPQGALRERSELLARRLIDAGVTAQAVPSEGAVGGGTYPDVSLPSWAVQVTDAAGAERLAWALRQGDPAVVGRIVDGAVRLDMRTIAESEEEAVVRRVVDAVCAPG